MMYHLHVVICTVQLALTSVHVSVMHTPLRVTEHFCGVGKLSCTPSQYLTPSNPDLVLSPETSCSYLDVTTWGHVVRAPRGLTRDPSMWRVSVAGSFHHMNCLNVPQVTPFPVEGCQAVCSWVLVTKTLWRFLLGAFCGRTLSFLVGKYLAVKLLGHWGLSVFNFWGNCQTASKWLSHFVFTPRMHELWLFCRLTNIWGCRLFCLSHSSARVVDSCYRFNLHLPNDYSDVWQFLMCFLAI